MNPCQLLSLVKLPFWVHRIIPFWVPPIVTGGSVLWLQELMRLLALGPYVGQEPMWKETSGGQFSNINAVLEPIEPEAKDQEDQS